jgi:N-acetyl-anhydromuramyl-L-alanine amidase AmpD
MQERWYSMQSCADWLRNHLENSPQAGEQELELAGEPPDPSVYQRMREVGRIVIHHSATETGCARVFRALHRAVNGWVDIGYHFVIGNGTLSADGEIEQGRPEWAVGAHARRNNDDSLGVCLVGNMDLHPPTEAQCVSLARLLGTLMSKYGLSLDDLVLHGELPECSTRCPGDNISRELLKKLVQGSGH